LTRLNIGASPIWASEGWKVLDHKIKTSTSTQISGNALEIDMESESCDVVFCSHVFEHIPHINLPVVLAEINRILKKGGLLRILTPDLKKIANAYTDNDQEFFNKAVQEDESIRLDLGIGGMFMNFIVSPGQDTVLVDRSLSNFIAGYAHLYCYDYEMLSLILNDCGFTSRQAEFCDSVDPEMKTPLHVKGMEPTWQNLNQGFYEKHNLVHKLVDGKYVINFRLTGFDRDPVTSLIIESRKVRTTNRSEVNRKYNESDRNYNRYSRSLLTDEEFVTKLTSMNIKHMTP